MKRLLMAGAAVAVLFAAWGCRESKTTSIQAPDRVVGVEWLCTLVYKNGDLPGERMERRGPHLCAAAGLAGDDTLSTGNGIPELWNRRQELTIRTASGTSYTVNVLPDTKVAIGDVWPPSGQEKR